MAKCGKIMGIAGKALGVALLSTTVGNMAIADRGGNPDRNSLAIFQHSFSADCATFTVSSSKDLSNVVLLFTDGTWQKFDGLTMSAGTFNGTGDNDGKAILTAYVKSGSFRQRNEVIDGQVGAEFTCAGGPQ